MSLLSVVNDVCAAVGVHVTTAVVPITNTDRTMQEMVALANEIARRIATDARDWTLLRKSAVLPGDGVKEAFDLPADYRRMLTHGNVWLSNSTLSPARFIPNTDEWLQRRATGYENGGGEWTMYGGQIHIRPVLGAGTSARFPYLDKNCIDKRDALGVLISPAEQFTSDQDTFRLDERLLKLGMLWQWKANKGSPYAEDMGTYQDAILTAMGSDSPGPTIIDRSPISQYARVAYPWPAPTP